MGYRLRFTETLATMADHGPDLQLKAHCGSCGTWWRVRLDDYARAYGWEFTFWDWLEGCDGCGAAVLFLCSPGPSTPLLPMRSEAFVMRLLAGCRT